MAGIGAVAAPPQSGAMPQQEPGAPEGGDEPEPNVTAEEQAGYDEFVTNGMKLIYQGEHVAPAVLEQLRGEGWDKVQASLGQIPDDEQPLDPKSPIDGLAVATVAVVLALEASAAQAKHPLDPGVVFHGGAELMEQLAEIAQAASIHDFSDDEMNAAANRAAMLYGVSSKSMDKQQALAEFDHFLQTQGAQLEQSAGAEEQPPTQGA